MKRFAVLAVSVALLAITPVAGAAGGLSGTYQTKIGSKPLGGQLKGTWRIKFSHGKYKVSLGGQAVVRGTFAISGAKITFGKESGPAACGPTGVYTFKKHGAKLTFTRVSDDASACAGRATILAGHFTKV